jgi:hypothetical protein
MAKNVADAVLDAALNYVKSNAAKLCVCTSEPTTYAAATSTYKLASTSISSSAFTGPANGDSSGRKIQVNAASSIAVDSTGSAAHVAIVSASALLYTTTCSSQGLTASNTVNVPAWDIEIADPS